VDCISFVRIQFNSSSSIHRLEQNDSVAVSAAISLLKPDIWKATKDFVCCRCHQECDEILNGNENPSNWELSSFRFSSLRSLGRFSMRSGLSMSALPVEGPVPGGVQQRSSQSLYSNDRLSFNNLGAVLDSLDTVEDDESFQSVEQRELEFSTVDIQDIVEVP
jgi:hypothetical protein